MLNDEFEVVNEDDCHMWFLPKVVVVGGGCQSLATEGSRQTISPTLVVARVGRQS